MSQSKHPHSKTEKWGIGRWDGTKARLELGRTGAQFLSDIDRNSMICVRGRGGSSPASLTFAHCLADVPLSRPLKLTLFSTSGVTSQGLPQGLQTQPHTASQGFLFKSDRHLHDYKTSSTWMPSSAISTSSRQAVSAGVSGWLVGYGGTMLP